MTIQEEQLNGQRGTKLRENTSDKELMITISSKSLDNIFLINGRSFITENLSEKNLRIAPNTPYQVINNSDETIMIYYSLDISDHSILYDPYKYEQTEKETVNEEEIKEQYDVPSGYVDTLPKWYSFKFTYPEFNLIFIRPEMGISVQIHDMREEFWKVMGGKPIILNGNTVHYNVEDGETFEIAIHTYHTVINPHQDTFVILKERWGGTFDEEDIERVFNPNNYQ